MTKIAVVGAGYVGLVTGACLAKLGHAVLCLEVDERRLIELKNGRSPIHEPGLSELLAEGIAQGRLRFSDDYREVATVDFAFIAVPTPPREDGSADTAYVRCAVSSVLNHCSPGLTIAIKSTVPVGLGDEMAQLAAGYGKGVEVVSNPEFLRQGAAVRDFLEPDRVVIGASSVATASHVADLYSSLKCPVLMVTRKSAELGKYTANALLASKISFMNEISHIASALEADVDDVARIVGTDRRIGTSFLQAGLGWGGSCFPKDVLALSSLARSYGCPTPILRAVYDVNEGQKDHVTELLVEAVQLQESPVVAILGLAFKPKTDDVRGSPALDVARRLLSRRVAVRAHDPQASANAMRMVPELTCPPDPYEAVAGADAVLLATEWPEYQQLDWILIRELMRGNVVIDGRNVLDLAALSSLGFRYSGFGRRRMDGGAAARSTLSTHRNGDQAGAAFP